jgi:hypothetical protein
MKIKRLGVLESEYPEDHAIFPSDTWWIYCWGLVVEIDLLPVDCWHLDYLYYYKQDSPLWITVNLPTTLIQISKS